MSFRFYFIQSTIVLFFTSLIFGTCYYFRDYLHWSVGILSASITLGSILCGFDSVHKNTLLTVESSFMRSIRETGYVSDILASMQLFSRIAIIFVLLSLMYIVFFCCETNAGDISLKQQNTLLWEHPIALFAWIYLLVAMLKMFSYVHHLFDEIIKKSCDKSESSNS